nr:hypothetical protein [Bacteroidota bacterium]
MTKRAAKSPFKHIPGRVLPLFYFIIIATFLSCSSSNKVKRSKKCDCPRWSMMEQTVETEPVYAFE